MRKFIFGALAAFGLLAVLVPAASAGHDQAKGDPVAIYKYDLNPVPHDSAKDGGSNASGTAMIIQRGNQVTVKVKINGLAPGQVHAQHLHGVLGGANECPTIVNDTDGNGLIDTLEGLPTYGGIQVSLTTSGDISATSALAVDRFPVADANGRVNYMRTFTVSDDVAAGLGSLHVVSHGIDLNNNGVYDFGAGPSSLTDAFPLEATIPAACGGARG